MSVLPTSTATHSGPRRRYNEDSLLARPDLGLWVVADGAGGHQAGDVASRMICESLNNIPVGLNAGQLLAEVRHRIGLVHEALLDEAGRLGGGAIMASTVVILLIRDDHYAVLWAGDSRVYRLRGGVLTRLTRDHSLVQELVDAGELAPDKAESHPQANVITRAVGAGEEALVLDKSQDQVLPGDRFLLCSDGLTKTLPEAEIAATLAVPDQSGLLPADMLIAAALARAASDNVTAVVVTAG